MSEFRGIPVVTTGTKYQTEQGFAAIKNGVKARADRQQSPREPKPSWLKARLPSGERFERLHAPVPVLRGRHGEPSWLARFRRARELGAHRRAHGLGLRRADVRRPRRPA